MEILSYGSAPCCYVVNSRLKLSEKCVNSRQLGFPTSGNHGIHSNSNTVSRFCNIERCYRSLNSLKGCKDSDFKVYSGGYDGVLVDGEEDVRGISGIEKPASKVVIPSLPNESKGEHGAEIRSCYWEWKPKLNVHYEKAGCENLESPQILFLPGFGVGAFHYEKQMKDLGRDFRVWSLDFLGQGMSLPFENPTLQGGGASNGEASLWGFGDETEPWAEKLVYSMDLWQDQVRYFIEKVSDMHTIIHLCSCFIGLNIILDTEVLPDDHSSLGSIFRLKSTPQVIKWVQDSPLGITVALEVSLVGRPKKGYL